MPIAKQKEGKAGLAISIEQTTPIVVRGMQGMSSMGKPQRPGGDLRGMLMGHPKNQVPSAPTSEFTCTCATGWTGPTCEISE